MNASSRRIQRVYLLLLSLHTLAASFVWGINTLFLLDAGLSNTEAFAANAFFTAGMVLFEVPTGVIADTRGRRMSYLLGTVTLVLSTLLYLLMWRVSAPLWAWALSSAFLGLGFTFFSGAVEAWLVDALMGSSGAVVIQPILGRAADAWSYPVSYLCSAAIQALALPFIWLARRQRASTDAMSDVAEKQRE